MPPLFEGYPQKWAVKRETRQTRLRLKHVSFLVRFATRFCGDIQAEPSDAIESGFVTFSLAQRANLNRLIFANSEVRSDGFLRLNAKCRSSNIVWWRWSSCALRLPLKRCGKRIRNETCLSRRRVCFVSRFPHLLSGDPEGAASRARFSWVTFFGETKKVTGSRAAPGMGS